MKKYNVTALGEILIDMAPMGIDDAGDKMFVSKAGGAPVTFLATVAKYGGRAAFIGKVGDDMFGAHLRNVVKEAGIDDSNLITDNVHNTTLAFVSLDDKCDRSFSFYRDFNADTFLSKDDVDACLIKDSEIFHFGSLSLTSACSEEATAYALKTARESGCIITCDPNYRPALWQSEGAAIEKIMKYIGYTDILKVSREEAGMLSGKEKIEDAERFFLDLGIALVLITDAENGAYFATSGGRGHVQSADVVPVDTTGAGDIFFGSFIHKFISSGKALEDLSIKEISEFASFAAKNAGMSTLKKGGLPSIP